MSRRRESVITGGRGFVGVNLVGLLPEEYHPRVFDNLHRPSPTGWDDRRTMTIGDILNRGALQEVMQGATTAIHLAAFGSVIESLNDPIANFEVNVRGTLNVLAAAVDAGVSRFVFASTGGALIGDATPPVDETSLPRPVSPYGASKLCGEGYCQAFAQSFGLQTFCLRFANVYGPHSAHKKGAVTQFAKALMRDEPIVIYGDGSASRDYLHVHDVCRGLVAALSAPPGNGCEVLHLASGRETTVLGLAHKLRDIAGKPNHPIEFRARRVGEVGRNFASFKKARSVLGFEPSWSLEDGLAATWEWFTENQEAVLSTDVSES